MASGRARASSARVDLIRAQRIDLLGVVVLPHADPDVGVEGRCPLDRRRRVSLHPDVGPAVLREAAMEAILAPGQIAALRDAQRQTSMPAMAPASAREAATLLPSPR